MPSIDVTYHQRHFEPIHITMIVHSYTNNNVMVYSNTYGN
jgi:hypothetical protein